MTIGYPQSRLLTRLQTISALTDDERAMIARVPFTLRNFSSGQDIVRIGESAKECWLVVDGYLQRHKESSDGRRQILSVYVPGDIPDLATLYLSRMDHSLSALGPVAAAYVPHAALNDLLLGSPTLQRVMQREILVDAAISREWILNIGTRQALARVAHLLCEITTRLRTVGLAREFSFTLPMSQADLAEATGISTVHSNRVVQELRARGTIDWRGRTLKILDWDGLVSIGDFSPGYLHLQDQGDA
jgi:CRP-like cAMP-binding protein